MKSDDDEAPVILDIETNGDVSRMAAGDTLIMTAVISGLPDVEYTIYW